MLCGSDPAEIEHDRTACLSVDAVDGMCLGLGSAKCGVNGRGFRGAGAGGFNSRD